MWDKEFLRVGVVKSVKGLLESVKDYVFWGVEV